MKRTRWSKGRICLVSSIAIVLIAIAGFGTWGYKSATLTYDGPSPKNIDIPANATDADIAAILTSELGDYGKTVYRLWSLRGGDAPKAAGHYTITPGDKAWTVAGQLKDGRPANPTVDVVFNNIRTMDQLAEKIASYFPWSAQDFLAAVDSVLTLDGYTREEFSAAFVPDKHQFYRSATPGQVVNRLVESRNTFWTDARKRKAEALGLTPVQIATLASIVEEESNNASERPAIARLYLNRLSAGMKLQADPTVKFALGDFTLKRLYQKHLAIESPYNTYLHEGLPPGPIRIPEGASLDAVLNAPQHNFIYMCAKPDGSGTHAFTDNYKTHLANARAYREWLDSIDIK